MRNLLAFTTLMMLFAVLGTVKAQSGLYEAEDYSRFTYTGSGWVELVDGDYIVMESSQAGDLVEFSFIGTDVILYRELIDDPIDDATTGGSPNGTGITSGNASNGFNDVNSDWVEWSSSYSGDTIGYTFPSPKAVTRFTIRARNSFSHRAPRDFNLEYFDGSSWQLAESYTGYTSWLNGETKTFTVENFFLSDQWRLAWVNSNDASFLSISEIEMFTRTSGTMRVCIDALCTSVTNTSSQRQINMPVAFSTTGSSHTLSIENLDGGTFRLNHVLILSSTGESGSDPILPETIAPDPSRHHFVLDSGRVVALDFVISGGDIATIILLVFLSSIVVFMFMNARFSNGVD